MAYIGNQQSEGFSQVPAKQDLTGATGTSLTLSHAVASAEGIDLFINNVRQEPTTAYSVVGTAVTLTGSVAASDDIYVVYNSLALQTTVTPDASVSTAKIIDGSVTSAKLAATIAPTNLETTASTFKMTDLTTNAFYRTGTFVPAFSSTAATDQDATIFNTYTHQKGFYTRIGNLVFAQVDIELGATFAFTNGGAVGQTWTVVDFPFKFKNVTNQASSINVGFFKDWTTGWATGYTPMGYGVINTTRVLMTYAAEQFSADNLTTYIYNSNSRIVFDITYETDDA